MCTALFVNHGGGYACRNLDLEYAYEEQVVIVPRRWPIHFRRRTGLCDHQAMIGTAFVPENEPLFYDAVNESGLSMAALNFPGEAIYHEAENGIAPFEMIPFVLSQCKTCREAVELLSTVTVSPINYSPALPHTPLHWLIADKRGAVAVEPLSDGLHITADPVGVLTNSPPLSYHLTRLAEYTAVTAAPPPPDFGGYKVTLYSRGMGGLGLPGDYSSASRFVKAAFVKAHARFEGVDAVSECFHLLDAVAHPRGAVVLPDGRSPITVYSSCCHVQSGVYYYKTYDSHRICAVDLHRADLDSRTLRCYPHMKAPTRHFQN